MNPPGCPRGEDLGVQDGGPPAHGPPPADPTLRLATPADLPALQRFTAALSLHSRVQRFFAPLRQLPSALVRAVEQADPCHRLVLAEDAGEIVALGQHAAAGDGVRCEVAIVVADRWQGRGLGRRLLGHVLDDAAARGLREAVLETLAENGAMQRLSRRAGFVLMRHPGDPGLVLGRRLLAAA